MKESRTRNRYFSAILYSEDVNFEKYKNNIEKNFYEVTYIKHDKDIEETGEIKKEHYHFLFKVGENARTLKSVAKEIEIQDNYLQGCNKKAMLQYLIHLNNPEKAQYNIEEVKGQLKKELEKIIENKKTEEERLEPIIKEIRKGKITNIYSLILYGLAESKMTIIRKYQYILIKTIEEMKRGY